MSERERITADDDAAWSAVAEALGPAGPLPADDVQLARLRRRVAESLPAGPSRPWWRAAAAAAAVVFGLGALAALRFGAGAPPTPAAPDAPPVVERAADGGVLIEFKDAGRAHRVAVSTSPAPSADAVVRVAKGKRLVDRSEPKPGEVVFYRID